MLKKISTEKKTGVLFIVMAVVLGLVAVGITYAAVDRMTRREAIWVANQDIYAGDPLSVEMFREVEVPIGGIPSDAVVPGADLSTSIAIKDMNVKETLRTPNIADLGQNDLPIISSRLRSLDKEALANLSFDSEKLHQLRAGEIPTESIVGMLPGMKKGDLISVTSVFDEELESGETIQRSETIFDYIQVIALRSTEEGPETLVVALTNRQFEALALAREKGKFYIALMAYGINTPDDHPEILSEHYVTLLDNPESMASPANSEPEEPGDDGLI